MTGYFEVGRRPGRLLSLLGSQLVFLESCFSEVRKAEWNTKDIDKKHEKKLDSVVTRFRAKAQGSVCGLQPGMSRRSWRNA